MITLTKKQLDDKLAYVKRYMGVGNAASLSEMDANANVDKKNVATLAVELNKDTDVQLNRYALGERITELFGKDCNYEYYSLLEDHFIYVHDESAVFSKPYCVAINLYPFLTEGTLPLGGDSRAPKHLDSFCGSYVNLIFAISSQFAGAVADVSMLTYMDYFARKDHGDNYTETHADLLHNKFQQIFYTLNEPAGARGYQAVFYNTSIFDEYYFKHLFGNIYYPDGTSPDWNSVKKLQVFFMKWLNAERKKALLTFPVVTAAFLIDSETKLARDIEFKKFLTTEMEEGNSFFIYNSETADSLSSCCFSGDQKIVTKSSNGVFHSTFKEFADASHQSVKRNLTIMHNGSWVKGKLVTLPYNKPLTKITTKNGKILRVTEDHLHVTLRGEVATKDLNDKDFILFNSRPIHTYPDQDKKLSNNDGLLIGMYLGDGSMYKNPVGNSTTINLSLNEEKYDLSIKRLREVVAKIDSDATINLSTPVHNVFPVVVHSTTLESFIREYVDGNYCYEKRLNSNCLLQSMEFRRGILEGYYLTDGGNSNRIYSTSPGLIEDIELLCTSLGLNTIINISDRTDEPVIIRGEEFKRNYPLYCVRWYDSGNKRSMGDIFKVHNNSCYFGINSIVEEETPTETVYCFSMDNEDEPYFTLPNGVITHNCRLTNKLAANTFSYTLGGTGVSTGSKKVITLNMNRIIQKNADLLGIVQNVHKFLIAYNSILQDHMKAKMLPVYDAGFISLDKQYLTIGVNGIVEAAEYMGFTIDNNPEYLTWVSNLLKVISDENKIAAKMYSDAVREKIMFNTEFVPAENLGVKFAKWDKKDGLKVNRDCYNSYLYIVEDDKIDFYDKFQMHGREVLQYLDGGSALHLNLSEHPTADTWEKIIDVATKAGCSYFTYNVRSTICNRCGNISKQDKPVCPKCGSDDVDHATRIIGYLKRITSFSNERQKEEGLRAYHDI